MIKHFNLLRKLFINEDNERTRYWTKLFKGKDGTPYKIKHQEFINWITAQYKDISELFYLLQNNMTEPPKCKICGKEVKWHNRHYADCCCGTCSGKLRAIEQKRRNENDDIIDDLTWNSSIPMSRYDNMIRHLFIDESRRGCHTEMYNRLANSPKYLHKYINIRSYIRHRFGFDNYDIHQTLWRLKVWMLDVPKCKICGRPQCVHQLTTAEYYVNGYCSTSCKMKDTATQDHIRNLSIERYGSINNAAKISKSHRDRTAEQVNEAMNKRRQTNTERYGNPKYVNTEQMKQTIWDKYHVTCTQHIPEVHEKTVKTLMEKFGVDHQSKSPAVRDKISKSNKAYWDSLPQEERDKRKQQHKEWWDSLPQEERDEYSYRTAAWWASLTESERKEICKSFSEGQKRRYENETDEERELRSQHIRDIRTNRTPEQKAIESQNKKLAALSYWGQFNDEERENITNLKSMTSKSWWSTLSDEERHELYLRGWWVKYENGTLTTSGPETRCLEYAQKLFPNTSSQDVSEAYPFHIDIHINEMNVYIEYQGTWTHGEHPYNPEDKNDVAKAEYWKSKGTKYYLSAYNNWTVSDPKKRLVAKKNGLRWYECWTEEECYELIDKLYEEYVANERN